MSLSIFSLLHRRVLKISTAVAFLALQLRIFPFIENVFGMLLYYKLSHGVPDTVWIGLVAVEDNDEFVYTSKNVISATQEEIVCRWAVGKIVK